MFWTGLVPSGRKLRRTMHKLALTLVVATGLVAGGEVTARTANQPGVDSSVSLAALPPEVRSTHRLILTGGPFPYDKDLSLIHI